MECLNSPTLPWLIALTALFTTTIVAIVATVRIRHRLQHAVSLVKRQRHEICALRSEYDRRPARDSKDHPSHILTDVPSIEEHEPAGDAQTAGARNASDDEFLTTLRQIVNSRMGNEEIDAAHLAPLMSMSQTQLRRKIAATSGISAARYVLSLRIERAKELLAQHPHMSIIDVAYSTGFSDNQHFTRVFHRMVGVTPMQYARSHSN